MKDKQKSINPNLILHFDDVPLDCLALQNKVVFVDVGYSGNKREWNGVAETVASLGALIISRLTSDVDICVFKGGKVSNWKSAKDLNIPCVSVRFIEECKLLNMFVDPEDYPAISPFADAELEERIRKIQERTPSPINISNDNGLPNLREFVKYHKERRRFLNHELLSSTPNLSIEPSACSSTNRAFGISSQTKYVTNMSISQENDPFPSNILSPPTTDELNDESDINSSMELVCSDNIPKCKLDISNKKLISEKLSLGELSNNISDLKDKCENVTSEKISPSKNNEKSFQSLEHDKELESKETVEENKISTNLNSLLNKNMHLKRPRKLRTYNIASKIFPSEIYDKKQNESGNSSNSILALSTSSIGDQFDDNDSLLEDDTDSQNNNQRLKKVVKLNSSQHLLTDSPVIDEDDRIKVLQTIGESRNPQVTKHVKLKNIKKICNKTVKSLKRKSIDKKIENFPKRLRIRKSSETIKLRTSYKNPNSIDIYNFKDTQSQSSEEQISIKRKTFSNESSLSPNKNIFKAEVNKVLNDNLNDEEFFPSDFISKKENQHRKSRKEGTLCNRFSDCDLSMELKEQYENYMNLTKTEDLFDFSDIDDKNFQCNNNSAFNIMNDLKQFDSTKNTNDNLSAFSVNVTFRKDKRKPFNSEKCKPIKPKNSCEIIPTESKNNDMISNKEKNQLNQMIYNKSKIITNDSLSKNKVFSTTNNKNNEKKSTCPKTKNIPNKNSTIISTNTSGKKEIKRKLNGQSLSTQKTQARKNSPSIKKKETVKYAEPNLLKSVKLKSRRTISTPPENKQHIIFSSCSNDEKISLYEAIGKFNDLASKDSIQSSKDILIVGASKKRTIKVFIATVRGCRIVEIKWLIDSFKEKKILPVEKYFLQKTFPLAFAVRDGLQLQVFKELRIYLSEKLEMPKDECTFLIKHVGGFISENKLSADVIIDEKLRRTVKPCVKSKWITECIMQNKLLDTSTFLL